MLMRSDYIKSVTLHFLFPVVLMLSTLLLEKIWQRQDIRPVPEYLEISLLEAQPVKRQSAAVQKPQPVEPPSKPKPAKPKPAAKNSEEPAPPLPPEPPKPEEQPIVEKTLAPVEKPKDPKDVPSVAPTATPKKVPKKTPPPLPSLDEQMEDLLEDEQESLDKLKELQNKHSQSKQSQNKIDQDDVSADARRSDEQSMVGHYSALIRDRVEQAWSRPTSARPGMEAVLQVKLLPGGEVRDVEIIKSSGDQAFDYSALKAIREVRILPVPEDTALFNRYFRVIQFPFRPEDLQR